MWRMKQPVAGLDELDQRVVAALQVDGRASWRRIAEVIGAPERTVARRGARLLATGAVVVSGFAPRGEMVIVRLRCTPGAQRVAGAAIARRQDATFSYLITGPADCAAEINCPPNRLAALALDELPGIPGLVSSSTDPVVRYFRAVHQWQPGLLTPEEAEALSDFPAITPQPALAANPLSREERLLVQLLSEDGRRTNEELAALSGMSEATVRRRIDSLRRQGRLYLRAVVEPALLGLPVEALLWLKAHPRFVGEIGEALIQSHYVRYAAATTGEYQLLVHVAVPDVMTLHQFTTSGTWAEHVDMIETSMLLAAPKRTGVLHSSLRQEE